MKVLLIGGTGVLSSNVMQLSLENGHNVFILNRGNNIKSIPTDVTLIKADIKHKNEVDSVLKDLSFDVVVDFISYTVDDLRNSLSIFQNRCKQFVFISSACVYKRAKEDGVITENSPLINPSWDYSINKVECEKYLISKCTETGLKYTIVRPYITYGNTRIPYGIMPPYGWHWTLIARILNNKPVFIWDQGKTVCTLTHTSDFAKGLVGLFSNPKAYNEAFHIVSDESLTWSEVANLIGKLVAKETILVEIPSVYAANKIPSLKGMLLGDRSLDAKFDNSKIKEAVPNFICTTDVEKGILQTINYYKDNHFLNGIDYGWDAEIDKLISGYLNENPSQKVNSEKLVFMDYLSNASIRDKYTYYKYTYLSTFCIKVINRLERIFK